MADVSMELLGSIVGNKVGEEVVGEEVVGEVVVGEEVVGETVGEEVVGEEVVGEEVVGEAVGEEVVGEDVVGEDVGAPVGGGESGQYVIILYKGEFGFSSASCDAFFPPSSESDSGVSLSRLAPN